MSLVSRLQEKLKTAHFKDAAKLLMSAQNHAQLQEESMDVVAVLSDGLTEDTMRDDFDRFTACEELLKLVAGKCSPQEMLFELLERLELTKHDEIFTSILKVLQIVLLRLQNKKARTLEWSLNCIWSYIHSIELPDYISNSMDERELKLIECDGTVRRILQLYMTVLLFLKPIIEQIRQDPKDTFLDTGITRRNVVICFLLQLMGRPLMYLDVHRSEQLPTACIITSFAIHRTPQIQNVSAMESVYNLNSNQIAHRSICIGNPQPVCMPRGGFNEFRTREEIKESKDNEKQKSDGSKHLVEEENAEVTELKRSILKAALNFVPSHGWSKQAIAKGAATINLPNVANGLFPRGGIELVQHFYKQCNEELVVHLRKENCGAEKVSAPSEFARQAIEVRLRMLIPYMKHWPQALGLLTLPPNVPTSLANVLTMVDDICYYAGDRSIDFNWYTRRIGLASIYKATELYMLQDNSDDYEKTWKFLERRVEEANVVYDFLMKSEDATLHLQNAVGSAFLTARNILGIHFDRR